MSMQNPDVAQIFKKLADLLEIESESRALREYIATA